MTKPNDGGPAFPRPASQHSGPQLGMTLRDWFATHATENDIRKHQSMIEQANGWTKTATVEQAKYAYADAMLKARGQDG